MFETRDLCWLIKQVQKDEIHTWFIQNRKDTEVFQTIERELPLLFRGILPSERQDASIVFSLEEGVPEQEGYSIDKRGDCYEIKSTSEQGLLYGLFGLHRILLMGEEGKIPFQTAPDQCLRMINHWDNFDGTIERGYAGESVFFDKNAFRGDMELIRQYARLLAAVGLNAVSINNVNVRRLETLFLVKEEALREIKKIADVFASYGIKTFLSVNFAAPITTGNLPTADPLSREVVSWWEQVIAGVYRIIPDFAGFVIKADSEGEPGPFTYGRNHEEGANMMGRVIKPYGGTIIWRCFVYNCAQDWRDRYTDRARAAYDIFKDLDGCFLDNVILQIKNGPVDFQIREPSSPLFGALKKTNQVLEFQITQEYTGHQKDICFLVPMWKEILDFDTGYGEGGRIRNAIRGNSVDRKRSGVTAVGNVGMDRNWTGHKLAQANLYGYGRLIWDNGLSSEEIAGEWVHLSFYLTESDEEKIRRILLTSRQVYEDYTCPLGVGFMCRPADHYGCDVDGYEYDRWGTYHYADRSGVGRDRTEKTGTGYTRQYSDCRFQEYENLTACPDDLLLFFHHVPYTHILHSGKTVIQHIYDTHFQGVEQVEEYLQVWKSLKGSLDKESYCNVMDRLEKQLENAVSWRDQINTYFYRKSGIPDEMGRKIYD